MERAAIFEEAVSSFAAHVLVWSANEFPGSTFVVADVGLDLLVEGLEFFHWGSIDLVSHIFGSLDLLFVCRSAVHSATLSLSELVFLFHDIFFSYCSQVSGILVVSISIFSSVVHVISVGDIGTIHRLNGFEIDSSWTLDNVFQTMGKTITESIGNEEVADWVCDSVVRDVKED